jgi:hypothetical protein
VEEWVEAPFLLNPPRPIFDKMDDMTRGKVRQAAALLAALLALTALPRGSSPSAAEEGGALRVSAGTLSVLLSWETFASTVPWGYNVYRFPGGITAIPERVNLLPLPGGKAGSLADTSVRPGVPYAYRVTVLDDRGAESWLPCHATVRGALLPGDADGLSNGEGMLRVDGLDLLRVHFSFGSAEGDRSFDPSCDLTGDGVVDGADLEVVARNYGRTAPLPPGN